MSVIQAICTVVLTAIIALVVMCLFVILCKESPEIAFSLVAGTALLTLLLGAMGVFG